MTYNIMTCSSSNGEWVMGQILGDCSMAWFSFIIILFLCLITRRQTQDGVLAGVGFNFIGALIGGLGTNLLLTTLLGSARWSLLGGLLGLVIGGFVIGMIFDTNEGGEY